MSTIGSSRFTKVGGGLSFAAGSIQTQETESVSSIKETLKSEENAAKVAVESPSVGAAAQAIDVAGALATATDAIASIKEVREEQLKLAQEAESTASQELRDQINTAIGVLEDEVGRIASSATYNGSAVLDGVTGTFQGANGETESVQTGSASSLVSDLGLDVSSVADATTAVETLESTLVAVNDFSAGLEAASSKTDRVIERIAKPRVEEAAANADKLATIEDAESLAAQVAADIRSAASQSSPELSLNSVVDAVTSSLSPERVSSLLE